MYSILQGAQKHPPDLEEWHKAYTIPLFHLEISKRNAIIAFFKSVQNKKKENKKTSFLQTSRSWE